MEVDSNGVIKATGDLKAFANQAEKSAKSADSLDNAIGRISPSALASVAGVTALIGAVKGLTAMGSSIVNMASHFEQVQAGLTTVLQSAKKGKDLFEDLRKLSFDTTFGVDELASASTQLLNVGVKTKDLNDSLIMLGDLAQGDKNKFAELTSIFAKIQSTGRATQVQLNQFALRGIPINQTLKEMGVTGMANANDLTEAFKKLTDEGGQFHGAMNNIIDTIEGKRGFIDDTIKEILVNFGELSGLTSAYKALLDGIYTVLNFWNDTLSMLNEHPLIKALITGTLTTMITGLVAVIGVGLVLALKTVSGVLLSIIGNLTIINVLSGPLGWAVLAVAGIAGAITALASYQKATDTTTVAIKEQNEALKEQARLRKLLTEGGQANDTTSKNNADFYQSVIDDLEAQKKIATATWFEYFKAYRNEHPEVKWKDSGQHEYYRKIAEEQYNNRATVKELDNRIKKAEELRDIYNALADIDERNKNVNSMLDSVIPADSDVTKLDELTKKLEEIKIAKWNTKIGVLDSFGNVVEQSAYNNDKNFKSKIDEAMDYIQKQIDEISFKKALEKGDWRAIFENATGIKAYGTGKNGNTLSSEYIGNISADMMNKLGNMKFLYGENSETYKEELIKSYTDTAKAIREKVLELLGTGKFDIDDESINNMKQFADYLDEIAKNSNKQDMTEYVGGLLKDTVSSMSNDINNFMQGFQSGGIWGGIITALVGALKEACSNIENFDEAMNPITTIMKNLTPLLEWIGKIATDVTNGLKGIAEIISNLFGLLQPIWQMFNDQNGIINGIIGIIVQLSRLLKPINDMLGKFFQYTDLINWLGKGLEKLATALGWLVNWILNFFGISQEVSKAQEEEAERLRRLNDQYGALYDALKQQEDYYLQKKAQINGQFATESVSVNDMILTPNGTFSTHPEDTIMAMKHPEELMGKSSVVVNVNDYAGVQVQAKQTTDGNGNTVIDLDIISSKIAGDYADGNNGWDNAVDFQQLRLSGRAISL